MRSPSCPPTARARRLLRATAAALSLAVLTACPASNESPSDGPTDGPTDGPPKPRVQQVDPCPASVAVEIIEVPLQGGGFNYSPNPAMIQAGQVVRFRLSGEHNARSGSVFRTNPGKTECFRFNQKETLVFQCDAHGFTGRLIIQ